MDNINDWLTRAGVWRFGAKLFQEPGGLRVEELQSLVPLLPASLKDSAAILAADANARNDFYFTVLGPGGCAATESAYDLAAMANRGPLIAEVSAFYDAFAYPPRLTSGLAPDHIVVELDFLGYLALKVAHAIVEGQHAERETTEQAYIDFRDRHPRFWLEALRERLEQAGSAPFARAADWVCHAIAADEGASARA
jgi:TorA maturation chaperone TorD